MKSFSLSISQFLFSLPPSLSPSHTPQLLRHTCTHTLSYIYIHTHTLPLPPPPPPPSHTFTLTHPPLLSLLLTHSPRPTPNLSLFPPHVQMTALRARALVKSGLHNPLDLIRAGELAVTQILVSRTYRDIRSFALSG